MAIQSDRRCVHQSAEVVYLVFSDNEPFGCLVDHLIGDGCQQKVVSNYYTRVAKNEGIPNETRKKEIFGILGKGITLK